jgi:hypothetical protein
MEQEIKTITADNVPFDGETTPITLNPSQHNSGEDWKYSRGDHTHLLNLSDIELDLKLPVKIVDDDGNIKKVLIEKTISTTVESGNIICYFKFPWIPNAAHSIVTLNFSFLKKYPVAQSTGISYFKVILYNNDDGGSMIGEIDSSLNHARININQKKIVYYTDAGKKYYYFKIGFENTGSNIYAETTYNDISTTDAIPPDFSLEDMVLFELPKAETEFSTASIYIRTAALDIASMSGSTTVGVITSSNDNPGVTHPWLYPSTTGSWDPKTAIASTGFNIWTYIY